MFATQSDDRLTKRLWSGDLYRVKPKPRSRPASQGSLLLNTDKLSR